MDKVSRITGEAQLANVQNKSWLALITIIMLPRKLEELVVSSRKLMLVRKTPSVRTKTPNEHSEVILKATKPQFNTWIGM